MRKRTLVFTILSILAIGIGIILFAAPKPPKEDDGKWAAYRQYTSTEEIIPGKTTALATIAKAFPDVKNVDNTIHVEIYNKPVYGSVNSKDDRFLMYTAEVKEQDPITILYLYNDDTAMTFATSNETGLKGEYANYAGGGYAWNVRENMSNAILDESCGFRCTSIWGYNPKDNTVSLIYGNPECPIWA